MDKKLLRFAEPAMVLYFSIMIYTSYSPSGWASSNAPSR